MPIAQLAAGDANGCKRRFTISDVYYCRVRDAREIEALECRFNDFFTATQVSQTVSDGPVTAALHFRNLRCAFYYRLHRSTEQPIAPGASIWPDPGFKRYFGRLPLSPQEARAGAQARVRSVASARRSCH